MSNNPYPSNAQLACEEHAQRLLDEQHEAAAQFHETLLAALVKISQMSFPLGFPARGYDFCDLKSEFHAWMYSSIPEAQLEQSAMDQAREMEAV